jgi:hypothetical protein
MKDSVWLELLRYARWAPSPHNMQPWLFQLESNGESNSECTLFYNPKRLLPGTNPTGSFMACGFGILLETLDIAAAPLGLKVDVDFTTHFLNPAKDGPQRYATLRLVRREGDKQETLDRQLIIDRRTSRLPYDGRPLDPNVYEELVAVAASYGHQFEYSTDPKEVAWVVALNADTMFYDMSEPVARNEVASWMRFSLAEARKKADGLAAYAMNFNGLLMWLFARANWIFRLPGIYQFTRHTYIKAMAGTANVAWLSGPFFEKHEDWINSGRMLARLWLVMTKHGVYLHPFGSVITNPTAHNDMEDHFQNPARKHPLWMLVRLGYSRRPPLSQRLPLEDMIIRD